VKFKEQIRAVQQDLPITQRHDRWLLTNPNPVYSSEAVAFMQRQLTEPQRDRSGSFSGSATSTCDRRQIFAYMGAPRADWKDSQTPNILHNGTFTHLRWQLAGLTEGWLKRAEVPVRLPQLNYKGGMDGVLFNDTGFEFKTINGFSFKAIMDFGARADHIDQVHSYMMATGIDQFSVVYESKDTNEWRETIVHRHEPIIEIIKDKLEALNEYADTKKLPVILNECKNEEGPKFRNCPYRGICPVVKDWDEVQN